MELKDLIYDIYYEEPCPECGGRGIKYHGFKVNNDNTVTYYYSCSECGCDWDDTYEIPESVLQNLKTQ
jgi:DNA-directed RNA polymerase subunit M/transcription elongation factor TFIIS